jgi:hypothetical protein
MARIDKREQILARLFAVLQAVPSVGTDPETNGPCVYRNRDDLPDTKRPAILLLDASEVANESVKEHGRLSKSPNFVTLKPEIFAVLPSSQPQNIGVGQALSNMRADILAAVLNDSQLNALCSVGGGGQMQYAGGLTDMARGQPMLGEIGIMIWFTYVFKPQELI